MVIEDCSEFHYADCHEDGVGPVTVVGARNADICRQHCEWADPPCKSFGFKTDMPTGKCFLSQMESHAMFIGNTCWDHYGKVGKSEWTQYNTCLTSYNQMACKVLTFHHSTGVCLQLM